MRRLTRTMRLVAGLAVASPWLVPGVYAQLGTTTLTWLPATTYTDGAPLVLAEQRIYRTIVQGGCDNLPQGAVECVLIDTVSGGISTYVDDLLYNGTYYYAVTSVDAAGVESVGSNEAFKTVSTPGNVRTPAAPTNLVAT